MVDLRSFLAAHAGAVFRPAAALSVVQEITALQHALGARRRYPVVVVERPRMADGSLSPIPVVTNTTASRMLAAQALGIEDHRRAAPAMAARAAAPVAPVVVASGSAPVRAVVLEGGDADLARLPVLRQHEGDVGHYLTAGHCSTIDPDTGTDNTSLQRCCVRGPRRLTFYPYASSHNARNLRAWWARGEPCPVAIWIGHHPAVVMGAQAKLAHPESHWGAAGAMAGEAVRLTPSVTHGDTLMVPADAEIVIEGTCPIDVLEPDGPFAEYAGYMGLQTAAPVVDVTCITHRRDPLYHDFGAGLEGHLVPDNLAMEGALHALVKPVAPSLENVHVPYSGRRFHAYLQFRDPRAGEVRDAIASALGFKRLRTVVALDEDINLFDDEQVMWALATRIQWHRDAMRIDGLTHPNLDPSLPPGARTITKLGIDATLPSAPRPGAPKPFTPAIQVPEAALARAEAVLAGFDHHAWPER